MPRCGSRDRPVGSRTHPIGRGEPAALVPRRGLDGATLVATERRGVGHPKCRDLARRVPAEAPIDALVGSLILGLGVRISPPGTSAGSRPAAIAMSAGRSTLTVISHAASAGTDRGQNTRDSTVAVVPSTRNSQAVWSSPVEKSYRWRRKRTHSGASDAHTPSSWTSVAIANGARAKPSTPSSGFRPANPLTIVVPGRCGSPGYRSPTTPLETYGGSACTVRVVTAGGLSGTGTWSPSRDRLRRSSVVNGGVVAITSARPARSGSLASAFHPPHAGSDPVTPRGRLSGVATPLLAQMALPGRAVEILGRRGSPRGRP